MTLVDAQLDLYATQHAWPQQHGSFQRQQDPVEVAQRRLACLQAMPLPSRGRDSERRFLQVAGALTDLQRARYSEALR